MASALLPRRELADDWRGLEDSKSFASLEGEFVIEARHDGVGTIYCEVHLRQPAPPEWKLSAELDFGWNGSSADTEVPQPDHGV